MLAAQSDVRFDRPLEVPFVNASARKLVKVLVGGGIAMSASVPLTHPALLVFGSLVAFIGGALWHGVTRNNAYARARTSVRGLEAEDRRARRDAIR